MKVGDGGFGLWSVTVGSQHDSVCRNSSNSDSSSMTTTRSRMAASWVGLGGIDENEDPRDAAIRELREETGITSAEDLAEVPYWLTNDFPPKVREKLTDNGAQTGRVKHKSGEHLYTFEIGVKLHCRFLFKFTGKDDEINLLGDGTEKAEFGAWSWMSPEQVVDHAVDFKKPVYREDAEINLLGNGTEKAEFGAWSWMSPEQVVDHAVDFKKPIYREVLTAFSPHLQ
ncbi:hypothetical protein TEA_018120 [Camellia sinensis var. sinensis]|uniref:Nudix hydrolase domain-containing protein n=1 Tax=Camellia sinensis var. sinensis TaxID=542762 RepID=A0A4S4DBT5_CAMSN|nr:hypothetical protein TEA_018120 [Camellia sinensis var. sinensis]